MTWRRPLVGAAVAVLCAAAACQGSSAPRPPKVAPGPPAIPDTQPVVDAPLFIGQNAFATPLPRQSDFTPVLATVRADGANSGVVDGPAPLAKAPVTGSAALPLQPPLLWGKGGLTAGCQTGVTPNLKACLAAVDASTLTVTARWSPTGQDLNLATAVMDDSGRVVVSTRQGHLLVVSRPDAGGAGFRIVRDVDLSSRLSAGQSLVSTVPDTAGNLWFAAGVGPVPDSSAAGDAPAGHTLVTTTVGFVAPDDQVVATTLPDQRVDTGFAVDQRNVYLATAPGGASDRTGATGKVYDLAAGAGQVQTVWQESYDAGSSIKPGAVNRGTGASVVLLGSQYLAVTDNADAQSHLIVLLRGPVATAHTTTTTASATTSGSATTTGSTPTTAPAPAGTVMTTSTVSTTTPPSSPAAPSTTVPSNPSSSTTFPAGLASPSTADARLVCRVPLFAAGASAVTTAPIGFSSGDTNSVIVANGYRAPPPLSTPNDDGPVNRMDQMPGGITRVDVLTDGSGCQIQWTAPVRVKTAPVLSGTTGLVYAYTQDEARAATGSYIWYFAALDYATGRILWRQRAGAGSTKNDNRQPTVLGTDGVLFQSVPLGLVWMRDLAQQP